MLYVIVGMKNSNGYKVTWSDIKPTVAGRQGHGNVMRAP